MFQKSVLKNYHQDENIIANRWLEYQKYLDKIDFIKTVKEERYQDTFLKDIFENCLGYTLDTTNPNDFNLGREKKNETDGKKADGVIYLDNQVIGIIELKAQNTKNLDKVEEQAFNYHNSHSNSRYIIISNFDELRFYIDKKTAYEKFSLFNLNYEDFKKLHLLLSYESIQNDVPLALKEKTASFDKDISTKLYKDFSLFRTHLFENLVKNNTHDKAQLLRLTQKLCDRIIFILFAEDRGLLTPNTIKEIREEFSNQKFTSYTLYDIYKFYFDAINKGNQKLNIPKYNGGLFADDNLLDSLIIDDHILDMEAQALSNYDFMSDISVNILGHIFEQSLTDLEEINASINEVEFDSKKSKRKKDGVFYTPEYITKYILDNTLGKLCVDKREELKLTEISTPKNPKKPTKKEQLIKENLEAYRNWLLNLKILDPACGSGAFLNQALEYLISEHQALQKDLVVMGDITAYYEIEKSILENNLYGVDINEDAVEIARLSLWLRTATKGRELTKLADKIVCANSLLNMPFEENYFDIVIGNPPYVRQELIKELKPQLEKKYEVYTGTSDLYVYFYELSYNLLKPDGINGFICSNKFYRAKYGKELREFILTKMSINTIVDFTGKKVFEDAVADSTITIFKKSLAHNNTFKIVSKELDNDFNMKQKDLKSSHFSFVEPLVLNIHNKIEKLGTKIKDWNLNINRGVLSGFNNAFVIDKSIRDFLILNDNRSSEIIKPLLRGRDIKKYSYEFADKYLIFSKRGINIDTYPSIKEYLYTNYENLKPRNNGEKIGRKKGTYEWYELQDITAYYKDFEKEKIIWLELSDKSKFTIDDSNYTLAGTFIMSGEHLRYLLAFLNSNLIEWYFDFICNSSGVGTNQWKKVFVEQIPIPKIDIELQKPYITLVDNILKSKQRIKDYKILLEETLKSNNFDREIKLKSEIDILEKIVIENENKINTMVYKLYGLDDNEIRAIERN